MRNELLATEIRELWETKDGGERTFSQDERTKADFSRNELLAMVFLRMTDRSLVRENGQF